MEGSGNKLFVVMDDSRDKKQETKNHLYSSNEYAIRILKFLGVLPISTAKDGSVVFNWRSFATLYCTLTVGACLGICYMFTETILEIDLNAIPLRQKMVLRIVIIYMWSASVGIAMILDSGILAVYIGQWRDYQQSYQDLTGRSLKMDYRTEQGLFFAVSVGKSATIATMTIVFLLDHDIFRTNGFSYAAHGSMFVLMFYVSFMSDAILCLILFMLKGTRESAEDLRISFTECGFTPLEILKHRQLWRELCEVTRDFSDAFGKTITTFLMFGYVVSMCSWYLLALKIGDVQTNIVLSIWTTFYVILISDASYRTIEKVWSIMMDEIAVLRKKGVTEDERVELNTFEALLNDFPPLIMLCGCFDLNRSSVAGVYAAFAQSLAVIREIKLEKTTET